MVAKEPVFQWVDEPPEEPPRRGQLDTLCAQLKTKPGKWARISGPYKNPSYGRNMVKAWSKKQPKFEFVARPGLDGDVQYYVYGKKRTGRRRASA